MRLLFWLLLAGIVYFAARSRARSMQQNLRKSAEFQAHAATRQANGQQSAQQAASQPQAPAEKMVECAHCHVYLPASEALHLSAQRASSPDPQFFCSEEHLRLYVIAATTSSQQPNE